MDTKANVGILTVNLFLGASQSLKDKRMVVKSLKAKVASRFNVSVAEVGGQDKWQVATLAFAMVNADHRHIEQSLQSILSLIESNYELEITEHEMEFL